MKKRVMIAFPTAWDRKQLDFCRAGWRERHEIIFGQLADVDCPADFDVLSYIDSLIGSSRGVIDGVMSSSDYPGAIVAAAIATALGLPGPAPGRVIDAAHKHVSRVIQQRTVPEATPRFGLLRPDANDLGSPGLEYPFFVKPVKGAFSQMARRAGSESELREFFSRPEVREFRTYYVQMFNDLLRRYTDHEIDGGCFLAEELLVGQLVTVEGFASRDRVQILGIVDSIVHPGTGSFVRFDYPSSLEPGLQDRMVSIAGCLIPALGLEETLFNIEMIHDAARDALHIIEVNPRLCGQFADLYEKVDGTSSYLVALALATGETVCWRRREGQHAFASSTPLRIFEPSRVDRAPDAVAIRTSEERFPGALVWNECYPGQELSDFLTLEDGKSSRYGIINAGADSREQVLAVTESIREHLGYAFTPL